MEVSTRFLLLELLELGDTVEKGEEELWESQGSRIPGEHGCSNKLSRVQGGSQGLKQKSPSPYDLH